MRPVAALEERGNQRPERARCHRSADRERQRHERRRSGRQVRADHAGREAADRELPLGADVEEACAKREIDGDAREEERRRLEEHLPCAVARAPRSFEDEPGHRTGRRAVEPDEHAEREPPDGEPRDRGR